MIVTMVLNCIDCFKGFRLLNSEIGNDQTNEFKHEKDSFEVFVSLTRR